MTKETGQEQDLQQQVQELQNELNQIKVNNRAVWMLLVQISNRLLRSSTSIKTAVSSLLDFDIFWDETTQYEFLQAINNSTDELADLNVLMTLAFRSQAKTLEIETEPNLLQEILVALQNNINKNDRGIKVEMHYPLEGKPALVDYHYLTLALGLLIEVIFSEDKNATKLSIIASEHADYWDLQIEHFNSSLAMIIRHFFEQANDIVTIANQISPEDALKLMTVCRILYLQNIHLSKQDTPANSTAICLHIPMTTQNTKNE